MVEVKSHIHNEMIANKDVSPDVFGPVNVEEGPEDGIDMDVVKGLVTGALKQFQNDKKRAAKWLMKIASPENKYADEYRMAADMVNKGEFIGGNPMQENEEEHNFKSGDKVRLKPDYGGGKNSEIFTLSQWDGRKGWIGDRDGRGWFVRGYQIVHVDDMSGVEDYDVDEQSVSGGAGAYSTPFAFKKKKVNEIGSFEAKVKAKLGRSSISSDQNLKNEETFGSGGDKIYKDRQGGSDIYWMDNHDTGGKIFIKPENIKKYLRKGYQLIDMTVNEKILPDGRYADDMWDGGRMKRVEKLNENELQDLEKKLKLLGKAFKNARTEGESRNIHLAQREISYRIKKLRQSLKGSEEIKEMSSSGAVFSGGPTIQSPAWGTKNKLGSPKAIKATKDLGYKVVKSITDEEQ